MVAPSGLVRLLSLQRIATKHREGRDEASVGDRAGQPLSVCRSTTREESSR